MAQGCTFCLHVLQTIVRHSQTLQTAALHKFYQQREVTDDTVWAVGMQKHHCKGLVNSGHHT